MARRKIKGEMAWKYFQWLSLLFVEIYLDRYFNDRQGLCLALNDFVERFNRLHHQKQKRETGISLVCGGGPEQDFACKTRQVVAKRC
jgi:hypothetical protein